MADDNREPAPPEDPDLTREPAARHDDATHIGPYHLLQKIGEGGMGEVWVADQREPIRRTVAVKVIKVGMDTQQVVARFDVERQALAVMDHPAIAKVLDAGATAQGRPYFVMEYVKGEPITAYCDRQRLSTADRLALFIRVCEGVQHAHQKGIIHRDLKPSNVLVALQDGQPAPKIIDFGIAKATAHHLTEETVFTELGVLIGTPEYMSPEQAEMTGLDIDTRTDVYALGVLLYELLTGTLPFDRKLLREKGLDEIRRTIREKDPPKPSTRVTQPGPGSTESAQNRHTDPSRLASQLRGDLDWITMKALEKDRTRRYETAMGLANDVRRHLEHEPVAAGPPSAAYRTKKFVRRHRFGVAAGATMVVLLFAFAATMAVQARRIARERDRANLEGETAKQVSRFLVGLFEVAKPGEAAADSITARQILDKGADQIGSELRDRPEVRAALLTTMGQAYQSLGLYGRAERLLEDALRLRQRIDGVDSPEVGRAMIDLGKVLTSQGRFSDAERRLRDAVQLLRRLPGTDQGTLADGLVGLAWTLRHQAKLKEAEDSAREAVALYCRNPDAYERQLADGYAALGAVLFSKGDDAGAERAFAAALDLRRRTLGAHHPATLGLTSNLAAVWIRQGQYTRAEAAYREVVVAKRVQLGSDHPDLTPSLNNLGGVLFYQRKYGEAEAAYREALAISRKTLGDRHPTVAVRLKNLGEVLDAEGRYSEAEASFREALAIDRKALGTDHPSVAVTLAFQSTALRHMGRLVEAQAKAQEALVINTKRLGPDHRRTKEAQGLLGMALAKGRRWAEAEPLLLGYGAALQSKSGVDGDFGEVARQIVEMYDAWSKPEKAAEWRKRLPPAK